MSLQISRLFFTFQCPVINNTNMPDKRTSLKKAALASLAIRSRNIGSKRPSKYNAAFIEVISVTRKITWRPHETYI